jgi:hypothetical protein
MATEFVRIAADRVIVAPFSIDQAVWHVARARQKIETPCPFCAGGGYAVGKDGSNASCPKCMTRAVIVAYLDEAWAVDDRAMTVGQIRLAYTGGHRASSERSINYGSQKESVEWRFMCYETGIGSGSLWDPKDLFASRETAQAACDTRNAAPSLS